MQVAIALFPRNTSLDAVGPYDAASTRSPSPPRTCVSCHDSPLLAGIRRTLAPVASPDFAAQHLVR